MRLPFRPLMTGAMCIGLLGLDGCYRPPPVNMGVRSIPVTQAGKDVPSDRPQQGPLDCDESVRLVVNSHPTVRAARAGLKVGVAELDRIGVPGSFEIRVRDSITNPGEDSRVGLRWNIPKPGEVDAERYAAQAQVKLS